MKRPEKLTNWDFPDTIHVPDGYNMETIPDLTRANFQILVEHYNELVQVVNAMYDAGHIDLYLEED